MDSVASKVAIKVFVGFEQSNWDTRAREKQRQHDPCRPTPDYAATCFDRFERRFIVAGARNVFRSAWMFLHSRLFCQSPRLPSKGLANLDGNGFLARETLSGF